MNELVWLRTTNEFQDVLTENKAKVWILFKHSTRCPISSRASNEILTSIEEISKKCDVLAIDVIENRSLSQFIAQRINVRHESPQVIIFKGDNVLTHFSHFQITSTKIKESVSQFLTH
jgi:bacillithiol system protein YtxJ